MLSMKSKNLLICGLTVGTLSSCYQEIPNPAHFGKTIEVNASIQDGQTRAADNSWAVGDAIGIYMKKSTNSLSSSALAQNVKYITANGSGTFESSDPAKAITLPYTGTKVDFIAYYPYKTTISSYSYPVNLSDQSKQTDIDLLYSDNAKAITSSNPLVSLNFIHQLSKIVLNITSNKSDYSLSGLRVKIANVGITASFSLIDGSLGAPETIGNIALKTSADGSSAEAILMPSSDLSDKTLIFIVGEDSYTIPLKTISNISSFDKSTKYTFDIELHPMTGATAKMTSTEITDWINTSAGSATINQDSLPYAGSSENPYTIEEAKGNMGEKDVWVKGYIVGYYSGTSYSSFVNNADSVTKNTNIALASSATETDPAKTFPVSLSAGSAIKKDVLNLQTHPENLSKEILIKGDLESYFGTVGIKTVKNVTIDGVSY
jgi:hypothetical protein